MDPGRTRRTEGGGRRRSGGGEEGGGNRETRRTGRTGRTGRTVRTGRMGSCPPVVPMWTAAGTELLPWSPDWEEVWGLKEQRRRSSWFSS